MSKNDSSVPAEWIRKSAMELARTKTRDPKKVAEVIARNALDWEEFIVKDMCSLCGQIGILDTRGIKTPAGFECGGLHYCICPNGRALKLGNAPKEKWLARNVPDATEPDSAAYWREVARKLSIQLTDANEEIKDLKRGGMSFEDATCGEEL